ncbi:MAG: hypothetical protein WC503_00355 [Candidatus Shapirobacteria bacterium]
MKKVFAITRHLAEIAVTTLSLIGLVNLTTLTLVKLGVKMPAFLLSNIWGKPIVDSAISWILILLGILMSIVLSKLKGWWSLGCIPISILLVILWESTNESVFALATSITGLYLLVSLCLSFPSFQKIIFSSGY